MPIGPIFEVDLANQSYTAKSFALENTVQRHRRLAARPAFHNADRPEQQPLREALIQGMYQQVRETYHPNGPSINMRCKPQLGHRSALASVSR